MNGPPLLWNSASSTVGISRQLEAVIRSEVATLKLHRILLSDSHTSECLLLGSPLAFVEISIHAPTHRNYNEPVAAFEVVEAPSGTN